LLNSWKYDKKQSLIAIVVSALYILINSFLISQEVYWFSVLPGVLLILMIYVFALDKIYFIIAFFTPLAIDLSEIGFKGIDVGLSLPTEPLLFGLMFLFIIKLFYDKHFDKRIFTHPVSLSITFYLLWMFLTSVTSEYPLVSFKFFLARVWFVIPMYFFGIMVFKNIKNIPRFIWSYIIGLIFVIAWTISQHALNGFSDHAAHWVMSPFYNDHTSYGAVLAIFIPVVFGLITYYKTPSQRFFTALTLVILLIAIYLSISRAAWASVVIAIGIYFLLRFRIRISWILTVVAIMLFFLFSFQEQILLKMERNKQDSSANFVEHVESMSNIATDASNLERINRWWSAIRMFQARPMRGWGPGTYQFVYAPFQSVEQKTVISTNVGNRGTAHSEYLLALSEQGVIGFLSFVVMLIFVIKTAVKNFYLLADKRIRLLSTLLFLGLSTYMAHALFNNFLDTDKMAVPFFGLIAGIVAIDIYQDKQDKSLDK